MVTHNTLYVQGGNSGDSFAMLYVQDIYILVYHLEENSNITLCIYILHVLRKADVWK